MVECSYCKDVSKYATDCYKPYCKAAGREVDRFTFEHFCKSYSNCMKCPNRK